MRQQTMPTVPISAMFLTPEDLATLKRAVIQEFPGDHALQEVHLARKILAMEAQHLGIAYLDYIQQVVKKE